MEVAVLEQLLRDDPDDVAAWHSYADALVEQGDPRGTLILLEHRLRHVGPADAEALSAEMAALTERHQPEWNAELPPGVSVLARRNGFATKVGVTWSDEAPKLIEQALEGRFVTGLRIRPADDAAPAADDADDGDADEDDEGDGRTRPVDIGALVGLSLDRLTELDLSYLPVGESGTSLLAELLTDRLTALDLRYCGIGDAGLAAFAATARFNRLRLLRLQYNGVTADGVRLLWLFDQLTDLDLRYNAIGEEGAKALAEAPFAGSLQRLFLDPDDIGEEGVAALASSRRLSPVLRSYWRSV